MEEVVLVDVQDNAIGTAEKMVAHRQGRLHRAFSIFIFNSKGEMLLQQRALDKYHSGGLWTNACCSHPRPNENTSEAAIRRLEEELNITTPLNFLFSFQYKAEFENGLIEHELDHVFVGTTDDRPGLNAVEAMDYRYISTEELLNDVIVHPDNYTFWFKKILEKVINKYKPNVD